MIVIEGNTDTEIVRGEYRQSERERKRETERERDKGGDRQRLSGLYNLFYKPI